MASLDVDSLFTNIPLDETIDICVDNLYNDNENPPNIPKHDFRNLLNIATKESFFMFNNKYYKQVDGVTMGSPLGPALANIFMCSFESKWLQDCPNDFKPVFYRRYVDDIFALFSSPDHADKFKEYLSSKHPNINFSIEKEKDSCLPFLDVNIFHENETFATNIYRKKMFSGFYTNFKSFIPETYKTGLIKSLLFRCFSLCSDFIKFHHEIDKLKSILYKNSYLRDLIDKCIKEFLDKIQTPKPVVRFVPKKQLIITLPYVGKLSLQIHTRINHIIKKKLPYCNVQFVFQTKCKISNFCHWSCFLALFTNLSAVAAMLPIMAKLNVILKSECVNTWEFLHSLAKELKETMILPLKNTFYSAIMHPILKISQFLLPTTTTLKLR